MSNLNFHELFDNTFGKSLTLLQSPTWVTDAFCHYTSLPGLIGIIENNEIWLSDHRFLNDQSEYSYGKELATKVINNWIASEKDNQFKKFLVELLDLISIRSNSCHYVASMSLAPDTLDQWKGYGKNRESVCIIFSGDFDLWNHGNTHPTHIRQSPIIYNQNEQTELINKIIDLYKSNFSGNIEKFTYPFLKDLAFLIESQFILFKNKEYASEREIRLTISNLEHILKKKKPKHRISNGLIIPYITTKYISIENHPTLKPLPIKEIIVSPTTSQDSMQSIMTFIENTGYVGIKVSQSTIRFRG
jgi:hypothetical protein